MEKHLIARACRNIGRQGNRTSVLPGVAERQQDDRRERKSLRYEAVSRRDQKRMRGAGELSKTQTAPHCTALPVGGAALAADIFVIAVQPCTSVSDSGT